MMKFINCFIFFWAFFALLDPDTDCESGYGSGVPIETGSNPVPDPKQFFFQYQPQRYNFKRYIQHGLTNRPLESSVGKYYK
jgi:hypothetical protein